MAVEINALGRARVRCDRLDCERLFVPKNAPLTEARHTRARAELYGWSCARQGAAAWSADAGDLDFCPEHTSERALVTGG